MKDFTLDSPLYIPPFCIRWKTECNSGFSKDYKSVRGVEKEANRMANMEHVVSVSILNSQLSEIKAIK